MECIIPLLHLWPEGPQKLLIAHQLLGITGSLRQWCSFCKRATHKDAHCRRRKRDKVNQAVDEEDHTFTCKVQLEAALVGGGVKKKGLMVDSGATKHIITDVGRFVEFDTSFKPQSHTLELADGERANGIAQRKGTAKVRLRDSKGCVVDMMLMKVLYVPSFTQDIFSVKAATSQGVTVIFKEGQNRLMNKNGTSFGIHMHDRLFYLSTVVVSSGKTLNPPYLQCLWH